MNAPIRSVWLHNGWSDGESQNINYCSIDTFLEGIGNRPGKSRLLISSLVRSTISLSIFMRASGFSLRVSLSSTSFTVSGASAKESLFNLTKFVTQSKKTNHVLQNLFVSSRRF